LKPRVVVCDEHQLQAEGLARLLETEFEIQHVTHIMQTLADVVERLRPRVVVHGLSQRVSNGLDLVEQICRRAPDARVVVVTMWNDPAVAAEAFRRGASAYVLKSSAVSELFEALGAVLAGTTFVSPSLAAEMLHALTAPPKDEPRLTSRQQEILRLLASGKSMKEVAASLDLTPRTVAFQKYRIMRKFHISTSAELVRFAVAQRLV